MRAIAVSWSKGTGRAGEGARRAAGTPFDRLAAMADCAKASTCLAVCLTTKGDLRRRMFAQPPKRREQPQDAAVQIGAEMFVTVVPGPHPKFVSHRLSPADPMPPKCAFLSQSANKSRRPCHKVSL